jgi:hypothetical protein
MQQAHKKHRLCPDLECAKTRRRKALMIGCPNLALAQAPHHRSFQEGSNRKN